MTGEDALRDLEERLKAKGVILSGMAIDAVDSLHRARLEGKRQGVELARGFVVDYLRDLTP